MEICLHAKAVARAQIATGFGIIVFWILFFTVGLAPTDPPICYFAFERAFPLPDAVLAISLLTAGTLVSLGRPGGRTLALVCAGGLLFLGLLDAGFNIQNGIYTSSVSEGMMALAINLWCITLGIAIAVIMRLPEDSRRSTG
jgi:hypothetical protein